MITDTEHLFIDLLTICISFEKCFIRFPDFADSFFSLIMYDAEPTIIFLNSDVIFFSSRILFSCFYTFLLFIDALFVQA
jgi:hypothetical protein